MRRLDARSSSRASASLFGLEPSDPVTIAMGLAVLAAIGLAAAWVPAARASGTSVLDGLRAD